MSSDPTQRPQTEAEFSGLRATRNVYIWFGVFAAVGMAVALIEGLGNGDIRGFAVGLSCAVLGLLLWGAASAIGLAIDVARHTKNMAGDLRELRSLVAESLGKGTIPLPRSGEARTVVAPSPSAVVGPQVSNPKPTPTGEKPALVFLIFLVLFLCFIVYTMSIKNREPPFIENAQPLNDQHTSAPKALVPSVDPPIRPVETREPVKRDEEARKRDEEARKKFDALLAEAKRQIASQEFSVAEQNLRRIIDEAPFSDVTIEARQLLRSLPGK
jgi:hypothetical protein